MNLTRMCPSMVDDLRPAPSARAPDRELLIAWRSGDRAAGNALLRRHWAAIHRFFRSRVACDHDELAQRTFVACVEGCARIRKTTGFRAYLYGVANNVLRDHLRASRRLASRICPDFSSSDEDAPSPEALTSRSAVVALIDRARDRGLLLSALRRLSAEEQLVLRLSYWEQLSSPEIARRCQVPAVTVRGRLYRARRELLRQLERMQGHPGRWASTEDLADWAHDGLHRSPTSQSRDRARLPAVAPRPRVVARAPGSGWNSPDRSGTIAATHGRGDLRL